MIGGLIQERAVQQRHEGAVPRRHPGRSAGSSATRSRRKQKTNLLLFLTPYIIRDQTDYRRIFERKRKEQQEFVEQFYGRQPRLRGARRLRAQGRAVLADPRGRRREESQKLENGGPGAPGERLIAPPTRRAAPRPPRRGRRRAGGSRPPAAAAPEPEAPARAGGRAARACSPRRPRRARPRRPAPRAPDAGRRPAPAPPAAAPRRQRQPGVNERTTRRVASRSAMPTSRTAVPTPSAAPLPARRALALPAGRSARSSSRARALAPERLEEALAAQRGEQAGTGSARSSSACKAVTEERCCARSRSQLDLPFLERHRRRTTVAAGAREEGADQLREAGARARRSGADGDAVRVAVADPLDTARARPRSRCCSAPRVAPEVASRRGDPRRHQRASTTAPPTSTSSSWRSSRREDLESRRARARGADRPPRRRRRGADHPPRELAPVPRGEGARERHPHQARGEGHLGPLPDRRRAARGDPPPEALPGVDRRAA